MEASETPAATVAAATAAAAVKAEPAPTFNLLRENWIPCAAGPEGKIRDVSLREALLDAGSIREIAADNPPQNVAIFRLLLAILHRALGGPGSREEWAALWQARTFRGVRLEEYLDAWEDRFDLFHPSHPFYQTASVRPLIKSAGGGVIQLYNHVMQTATLYEHSWAESPRRVTPAETARLVVTAQAFDPGGLKSDRKSAFAAPLVQAAVAIVKGRNLFETLMLNLHVYSARDGEPFPVREGTDDLPAWERDEETEDAERMPDGYVDLLTWQSRRIAVRTSADIAGRTTVRDAVLLGGYRFPPGYRMEMHETMTAFRISDSAARFLPVEMREDGALWRDALRILGAPRDSGRSLRPRTFNWLAQLIASGELAAIGAGGPFLSFPVDFAGFATDRSKPLFWSQVRIEIPVACLEETGEEGEEYCDVLGGLESALGFAEELSAALGSSLGQLAGIPRASFSAGERLALDYWSRLEQRFRRLLARLSGGAGVIVDASSGFSEGGVTVAEVAFADWFADVDNLARSALWTAIEDSTGMFTSPADQKAATSAEKSFFDVRARLLTQNSEYREHYMRHLILAGGKRR